MEDYARSSTEQKAAFDAHSHNQAGDPAKLAALLLELADSDNPPLRFVAGTDAFTALQNKIDVLRNESARLRAQSVSTDRSAGSSVMRFGSPK
jgi:hypothetical protein